MPEAIGQQEKAWEEEDRDYITTARALVDGKDFVRAVHWLRNCKSAKAHFLSVYSQYMVSTYSYAMLNLKRKCPGQ